MLIRYALLALTGCVAIAVVAWEFFHPHTYLARDSFTYFTMARQFYETGMLFSYTGLDHTTGVHPLYYFFVLLLYPLFGMAMPHWSLVFNAMVLGGAVFLLYRALGLAAAWGIAFVLLVSYTASSTNNGMESALLFLALAGVVWGGASLDIGNKRHALLFGFLLGAALVARLDTIFFIAATYMCLFGYWILSLGVGTEILKEIVRRFIFISIPVVLLLALASALNLYFGDSILPLSGDLKSTFPAINPAWQSTLLYPQKMFVLALAVSVCYICVLFVLRRIPSTTLSALFLGTVLLYLYNGFFVSDIGAWYWTLPTFLLAYVVGLIVRELSEQMPQRYVLLVSVFAVFGSSALVLWSHSVRGIEDWITPHSAAADFLRGEATPNERAGEYKDGVFAFYSPIPVYNLTGLGNNRDYSSALQHGTLEAYVRDRSIKYLVAGSVYSGIQVPRAVEQFSCSRPIFTNGAAEIYPITNCSVVPF